MNRFFSRAQISVFIIVAIVIVILGILLIFFTSDSIHIWGDETSSYKIKEYVQACLDIQTREGITEIGLHGGWLYTPLRNINFVNKETNKYLIQSSKGMDLFGLEVPYWYYYDDGADSFKLNIPDYDSENPYSLKNQLKRYVDETLERDCIRGFRNFENIYDIDYDVRDIDTQIVFDGDDIEVRLEWPLRINELNTNSSEFVDTFKVEKDNKLRVPYFLARDIIVAEAQTSFVEKRMLQFISAYQSSEGRDLLPPFYDFKLTYDFDPWRVPDVEDLTKRVISTNLRHIQFYGTETQVQEIPKELKDNEFAKSFYNNYNKDYVTETSIAKTEAKSVYKDFKYYDVDTIFEYFYPMFFSLAPSMGDMVLLPRPEAVIELLPFFFTEYTAVYEITAPILFEIRDSRTPNDDFVFNLIFESNIDHNTPLRENKNFALNFESFDIDEGKSLICDPPQFISDYVSLNISDRINNGLRKDITKDPTVGVEDAIVTFDCKGLSSCYIGQTQINGKYRIKNISHLRFKLPINCDPGTLEIYKYGYKKLKFENLNPQVGVPIDLGEVYMDSKKTFKLNVKKIDEEASRRSSGRAIKDGEEGFLIVTNLEDEDLVEVVEFNKENQYNLSLSILPGNYSFEAFLIYRKPFTIPREKFCYKKGLFSGKDCETIPAIDFDSWVNGGLEIARTEVSFAKMMASEEIFVNIIEYGIPSSYDELSAMSETMSNLAQISDGKEPYFE